MSLSVFEHRDYRAFLTAVLGSGPKRGRGKRSELAKRLNCHSAYLSRVLSGMADLSLEQAFRAGSFFGLTSEESEYFQLLVQHARSGTTDYRSYLTKQIEQRRTHHLKLDNRLENLPKIEEPDRLTYYSHWSYAAVHIATAVPTLRSVGDICDYLDLSANSVRRILNFLVSLGLVIEDQGKYRIGKSHIHIDSKSEGARQHHANWRLRSINALDEAHEAEHHYTSVISCSRKDLPNISRALVEAVESVRTVVRASGDEVVCCYLLDLFEVGR